MTAKYTETVLAHSCPQCDAAAGSKCQTATGKTATTPHAARTVAPAVEPGNGAITEAIRDFNRTMEAEADARQAEILELMAVEEKLRRKAKRAGDDAAAAHHAKLHSDLARTLAAPGADVAYPYAKKWWPVLRLAAEQLAAAQGCSIQGDTPGTALRVVGTQAPAVAEGITAAWGEGMDAWKAWKRQPEQVAFRREHPHDAALGYWYEDGLRDIFELPARVA